VVPPLVALQLEAQLHLEAAATAAALTAVVATTVAVNRELRHNVTL
jgi:hypothetical protein